MKKTNGRLTSNHTQRSYKSQDTWKILLKGRKITFNTLLFVFLMLEDFFFFLLHEAYLQVKSIFLEIHPKK